MSNESDSNETETNPANWTEEQLLGAVCHQVMGTKITDWKPQIDEHAVRMEVAERLRDQAEMVLGYCHIDPTRSAITRRRIPKMLAKERARAAMSKEERAARDLLQAKASAEVEIMKREGLTFGEMHRISEDALAVVIK